MTPTSMISPVNARVAVKPAPTPHDHVDGAWWPRSTDLADQLPDLLRTLEYRLNPVVRVGFHIGDWTRPPGRMRFDQHLVRLDGYRYWQTGAIRLRGMGDNETLKLMVIPPATNPDAAAEVTAMAAQTDGTMTLTALLGLCQPTRATDKPKPIRSNPAAPNPCAPNN